MPSFYRFRLHFFLISFFTFLSISNEIPAQVLISPTGAGGFENGPTFADNGWTVVNGSVTNQWYVGNVATGFTGNSAYISNNGGTSHSYTNDLTSVVHFYRDVTFPANVSDFTLSFNWKADGETSSFDALVVSLAPTSYTPSATNVSLGTGVLPAPANRLAQLNAPQLWNQTGVVSASYNLSSSAIGNCCEPVTMRLIFTWKNDASLGLNPPAAIDSISLTYDPLNSCVFNPFALLIDPAGAGGFESGTSFNANGWTVVNGSVTNQWHLGNVATGFNNRSAYISQDGGTSHTYDNSSTSVVHFYRDINFPADVPEFTLSFNWKADGEFSSFDAIMVSLAPTSYTPLASDVSLGTSVLPVPANMLGGIPAPQLWNQPSPSTFTYTIKGDDLGNCGQCVTKRLIFTWKNDGSLGDNPPGAIDNISLITHPIVPEISGLPEENCQNDNDISLTGSPIAGPGETGEFIIFPDIAQFTDNSDGTASWSMEGTPAGDYLVFYRFTNEDGCEYISSDTISILAAPEVSISNTNGLLLDCLTPETDLSVANADSYQWTLNGEFLSNNQSIVASEGGTYAVTSTLNSGCVDSSSVIVIFTPDTTPPDITCPPNQNINLDENCTVDLPDYSVLASTFDYCGVQGISQSPLAGTSVSDSGNISVMLTVTDVNGLTNSCSFTVTKVDNITPTITCPDMQTLVLGTDCSASLPDYTVLATTDDNCGVQGLVQSPLAGTGVSDAGDILVSLTVTDVNGLTNSCSFTVDKVDNSPPDLICSPFWINFNGENNIFLDSTDFLVASDNCGNLNISINPSSVNSSQVGEIITVSVTVTDINNNTSTCESQLTIDGLPPGWSQNVDGINCADGNDIDYNFLTEVWTATSTNCFYGPPFNSDAAAFAQSTLCGNGSITARVTGINGGLSWAGIVIRESNDAGSKKVQLQTNMSGNQIRREVRAVTNGPAFPQSFPAFNKFWLRLVRQGNQFIGYTSADGIHWQQVLTANVSMNSCIQIGLTATNYNSNSTVVATFDNVVIEGGALPQPTMTDFYNYPNISFPAPDFTAYPNPTNGELTLDLMHYVSKSVSIEVYSIEGRLLMNEELSAVALSHAINLNNYQSGMYLIKVKSNGLPDVTKRIVKQD